MLLTGDMASEGVNLHRQCHHLIHFDLPWSLITIEQRNGRIDRYGQRHSPDVRALLLNPDHPHLNGDVRIFTKLLQREHEAHRAFGDSSSLLGVHTEALEEEAVMASLRAGTDPDEAIPAEPTAAFDLMAVLSGATGTQAVPVHRPPSLFESDSAFVDEALRQAFDDADTTMGLRRDPGDETFLSLVPPKDLIARMRALPRSYLAEQRVAERLKLTGNETLANRSWSRPGSPPIRAGPTWASSHRCIRLATGWSTRCWPRWVVTRRRSSSQMWTSPCSACRACTPTGVVTRSLWSGWPSPSTSARR